MYRSWQKKAKRLRIEGYSYSLIRKQIPVSKSTLSYWLRGIAFNPNELVKNRVRSGLLKSSLTRHKDKMDSVKKVRVLAERSISPFNDRDLLLFGFGLYLGEGAKSLQRVRIINSDPKVIRLAILWLRKSFNVPLSHLSLTIHLYPDSDVNKSLRYWSRVTKIPENQFRKSQIDIRKNKSGRKHGKLPFGTASLEVNGRGRKEFGIQLFRLVMSSIDVVFEKSGIMDTVK